MKPIFKSILILVSSPEQFNILMPLIDWLGKSVVGRADLIVFSMDEKVLDPIRRQLQSMRKKGIEIIVAPESRNPDVAVPSLVAERNSELLIACSEWNVAESPTLFDPRLLEVIEKADIPILVVPKSFKTSRHERSILVPMSGEVRENKALELSLQMGCALGAPVDIIHVTEQGEPSPAIISRYADGAHHELPRMIDEFLVEASPFTNLELRKCLRNFYISRGQATEEIVSRVKRNASELVAVQWRGTFMTGHARILKTILKETSSAVLLVKRRDEAHFKLRAGGNLRSLSNG